MVVHPSKPCREYHEAVVRVTAWPCWTKFAGLKKATQAANTEVLNSCNCKSHIKLDCLLISFSMCNHYQFRCRVRWRHCRAVSLGSHLWLARVPSLIGVGEKILLLNQESPSSLIWLELKLTTLHEYSRCLYSLFHTSYNLCSIRQIPWCTERLIKKSNLAQCRSFYIKHSEE